MKWDLEEPGVVELPGGRRVRGRKLSAVVATPPQWGLYAMWRDPRTEWQHEWIRWPDFGLPLRDAQARTLIREAYGRSALERVEVGCGGGRGRTGTILAALVMLDGLDATTAVAWVRQYYDPRAVETRWQRFWLDRSFKEWTSRTID